MAGDKYHKLKGTSEPTFSIGLTDQKIFLVPDVANNLMYVRDIGGTDLTVGQHHQADWLETDPAALTYIANKPTEFPPENHSHPQYDNHLLRVDNPHSVTYDQVGAAPLGHNHDGVYSPVTHDHAGVYEPANPNIQAHIIRTDNPHSVTYEQLGGTQPAPVAHTHVEADITDLQNYERFLGNPATDGYLLSSTNLGVRSWVAPGSPVGHTHVEADITDLDKYTQAEVDALLANKSDISHNHAGIYEPANPNIQAHISDTNNPHNNPTFTGAGTVGFVPDSITESGYFLADNGIWTAQVISPVGGMFINYFFDTGTDGLPGSGDVQLNNIDHPSATAIYAHAISNQGNDVSIVIDNVRPGEYIGIWEIAGDHEGIYFSVTGAPTRNGDVYTIPVAVIPSTTAIGGMENNSRVQMFFVDDPIAKIPIDGLTRQVLAKDTDGDFDMSWDYRMNWKGQWTQTTYEKHDVVLDQEWTMIANKQTTDTAAPQPSGGPSFDLPDVPAWAELPFSGVVWSGHQYTLAQAGWIQSIDVWVPALTANHNYRILLGDVTDPDPNNHIWQSLEEPVLFEDQWTTVVVNPTIYAAGAKLVVILDALNSGGDTPVIGGWTRAADSPTLTVDPGLQAWGTSNSNNSLRVNKTDLDSNTRGTELMSMVVGTTVTFTQDGDTSKWISWYISADPVDQGNHVSWGTVSVDGIGPGGEPDIGVACSMDALIPIPDPTDYEEIIDYWLTGQPTWATVEGRLRLGGVDQTVPNNAYGVRMEFQPAYVSPDWDVVAISGGAGGGGGGGGGGIPDAPEDGTMYARKDALWANIAVADVVGLQSALDGKAPTAHTHTESQITDLDKYTQAEVDGLLAGKSDTGHTHSQYLLNTTDSFSGVLTFNKGRIKEGASSHLFQSNQFAYADIGYLANSDASEQLGFRTYETASLIYGNKGSLRGTFGNTITLHAATDVTGAITQSGTQVSLVGHTHTESQITDLDKYTQAEVDSLLAGKSDTSHTHSNYTTISNAADNRVVTSTGGVGLYGEQNLLFDGAELVTSYFHGTGINARVKFGVWSSLGYGMGMGSGYTFGGLSDYALTFQMNNQNNRGFWWGDDVHTNAQGAMALTTDGKLTIAHSARIGYGEGDTATPGASYKLDVNGNISSQWVYINGVLVHRQIPVQWSDRGSSGTIGVRTGWRCTVGGITITLPASPSDGDAVGIADKAGVFTASPITVARNGKLIMGLAENMTISQDWTSVIFRYESGDGSWWVESLAK